MREEEQHCGTEKGEEGRTLPARGILVQRTHGMHQRQHRAKARQSASAFGLRAFIFDDNVEIAGFFSALLYRSAPLALVLRARDPLCSTRFPIWFHIMQSTVSVHSKRNFRSRGVPNRPLADDAHASLRHLNQW